MTTVVNLKRSECDVLIDRSTPLGNPHRIGVDGNRQAVIALHMAHWRYKLDNPRFRADALAELHFMKGKRLGCHCFPLPCHGDNYVKLIAEFCS